MIIKRKYNKNIEYGIIFNEQLNTYNKQIRDVEGIVWNRRYNIISIKNIIIKVYNIGNITAYCGISRYITVLRGGRR